MSSLTPEEQEELRTLAKRYNAETSKQHHKEMQDMQLKIDLLHEALDALPAEQEFARKPDTSPVPMHRPMIVENPQLKITRARRGDAEVENVDTRNGRFFGGREF